ncbi:MAG: nitrous oxide reductase family maturation protein NosD [Planctomycetota bacterium]
MKLPLSSLLLLLGACGAAESDCRGALAVPRPPHGVLVAPGTSLQAAVDAAADGATLLLQAGEYAGPVVIRRPLLLWGPPDAVLTGDQGSTLRVEGDDVTLQGFTVRGSGQRFDLMDGGIHLRGADLVVEGVTVEKSLFGILAERSQRVALRGNLVVGTGLAAMGLRGDGIRLWETSDSVVTDNVVRDSRDLVVWYSSRNRLERNEVVRSRYGTHFMYSHDNVVRDSRYVEDEVGVFVMYSHDILLERNLIAEAGGAAGMGLGMKESGNVTVTDNWFLANTTGIYVDNSPLDPDHQNRYARNVLRFAEAAVAMHSTVQRSEFVDNEFRDNGAVVKVGGKGDAVGCRFDGNHYDTYQGYDLDGDGRGDVPFEFRRLSTQLEARYPQLALLHGAPSMAMVDLVGEVMPLFRPQCLMRDDAPRLRPLAVAWQPEVQHAR